MTKNKNNKKSFSLYSFLGKIGDILFIPIIIISLFSSVSMLVQRQKNEPTAVFGYSLVNILSGSMTSQGFFKGDSVFTQKVETKDIQLGDVIAFYRYTDPLDKEVSVGTLNVVCKYNYSGGKEVDMSEDNIIIGINPDSITSVDRAEEKTVEDAQKVKAAIYFHQVIGIYVDDYGNIFFNTKGSENASTELVRSDFVVGEYVFTPRFVRDIISFCASARGMIILVCIPLSVLVLFQCFSLIKQIEIMGIEKQILQGKKRYDDEEIAKVFKGSLMETYNKAYLYFLTSPGEREQVLNYMWGDLIDAEKLSKRDEKELNVMRSANAKLETSEKAYWEEWINGTKGFTKRKLKKYYEEVAIYNVLNATADKAIKEKQKASSKNENIENTKKVIESITGAGESVQAEKEIKKPTSAKRKIPIKKETEQPLATLKEEPKVKEPAKKIPVKRVAPQVKKEPAPIIKEDFKVETKKIEETKALKTPLKETDAKKEVKRTAPKISITSSKEQAVAKVQNKENAVKEAPVKKQSQKEVKATKTPESSLSPAKKKVATKAQAKANPANVEVEKTPTKKASKETTAKTTADKKTTTKKTTTKKSAS